MYLQILSFPEEDEEESHKSGAHIDTTTNFWLEFQLNNAWETLTRDLNKNSEKLKGHKLFQHLSKQKHDKEEECTPIVLAAVMMHVIIRKACQHILKTAAQQQNLNAWSTIAGVVEFKAKCRDRELIIPGRN